MSGHSAGDIAQQTFAFAVPALVEQLLALQVAPDPVVLVVDRDIRIVHAAGSGLALYEWETEPPVGKLLAETVPPTAFAELEPAYRAGLSGEVRSHEFVSPATGRSSLQNVAPLRDATGAIVYCIATWSEIRASRALAQELAASEERFRLLAERNADVITVVDRDLVFEYVSLAMERVVGWRPEELVGQPLPGLIHPDDLPEILRRLSSLLAGGDEPPSEFRLRRPDGGYIWLEGVETPVIDPSSGEIVALQASVRDISQRKRAEELFTVIAAVAPVGIFRTDALGQPIYVNQRWCEVTGMAAEAALGDGWRGILHPDDCDGADSAWAEVAGSDRQSSVAFRVIRPDGEVRHVVSSSSPLFDASGVLLGHVGALTDVTELKEAEAQRLVLEAHLQQTQKLESLGVLAGGVAHDFNNLLVGVLGNAALAIDALPVGSPARDSLESIELAARRAAELTRQMLAYSGRGRFVIERTDLGTLVRETTQLLEATLGHGITLRLDLAEGLPPFEGDTTQLRQVVMNLIVNASEAIGDAPGQVEISVGAVTAGPELNGRLVVGTQIAPGRLLALRVSDTGAGMDEATFARIFEPSFTTKFTGRGLGLAATLGIVRGHGGGVEVTSAPGQGASFTIYLPPARERDPQPVSVAPPKAKPAAIPGTVLVIDDEELVRTLALRVLARHGIVAHVAAGGDEALALVRLCRDEISAVLLDLSMPGLAGIGLIDALREVGLAAPIVLTSGHPEGDALERLAARGVVAYLHRTCRSTCSRRWSRRPARPRRPSGRERRQPYRRRPCARGSPSSTAGADRAGGRPRACHGRAASGRTGRCRRPGSGARAARASRAPRRARS